MKILINDKIPRDKWQDLLKASQFSSPFQTPGFFTFFNSVIGYSADVFAIEMNQKLTCLMVVTKQKESGIKSWFSRRGIVYGGPLVDEINTKSLNFLNKSVIDYYKRKLIYIEIRNYFDYSYFDTTFTDLGFKFVPWLNFQVNISTKEQLLSSMSSSRARQIKKALKSGVVWKEAESVEEINDFYLILQELYITKIKKPLFSKDFFIEFFKHQTGKYLLVLFEGKVIGGIMCPILPGHAIYEFYVCGLDSEYKEQHPSIIATWAAMEYAIQNDIPVFDLMGAGSPKEQYGVREFKSRFGGNQVEYGRYLKLLNPSLYRIGKVGLSLLSKQNK